MFFQDAAAIFYDIIFHEGAIMVRNRERLINYALILLTVVYVAFVLFYDYQRIKAYIETLEEGGQQAGYSFGAMIIYVLFNICVLGGGSAAIIITLLILTAVLARNNGKSKKGTVITILVFQILGCALTLFGAILAFSMEHSDWVMKVVYTVTTLAYIAATTHTIVYFKKLV